MLEIMGPDIINEARSRLLNNRQIDPKTGCWEWTRGKSSHGYGSTAIKINGTFKHFLIHRLSYALFVEDFPNDLQCLHKCDNPICFNPDHLTTGTNLDNMTDRNRKNRHAYGPRQGSSKLTDDQVIEIKHFLHEGVENKEIAKRYGISVTVVSGISTGQYWKHLGPATPKVKRKTGWARDHECCISCGRTSQSHSGKGFCRSCRERERQKQKRQVKENPRVDTQGLSVYGR